MKTHPAAREFPLMEGADFDDLVESIRVDGFREEFPIVLQGDVLLDGRNRLRACKKLGREPKTRQYRGPSPVDFIAAANVRRRQLTDDQKAMIAVGLIPHYKAEAKERQRKSPGRPKKDAPKRSPQTGGSLKKRANESTARAGKAANTSRRKVERAVAIVKVSPKLAAEVKAGRTTLAHAEREIAGPSIKEAVAREPGMKWATLFDRLCTLSASVKTHGIKRIASKWDDGRRSHAAKTLRRLVSQLSALAEELES